MNSKITSVEILRCKECYNRMNLHITWVHSGKGSIKFERLRLDYGDSKIAYLTERKLLSEGPKI